MGIVKGARLGTRLDSNPTSKDFRFQHGSLGHIHFGWDFRCFGNRLLKDDLGPRPRPRLVRDSRHTEESGSRSAHMQLGEILLHLSTFSTLR